MRVQIEGMPHYDEQQVIFVLDNPSPFSARIPVILGTPTINRVIQTMKETEMHSAPMEWQMARVAYEWVQGFLPGGVEPHVCPDLLGRRDCLLQD